MKREFKSKTDSKSSRVIHVESSTDEEADLIEEELTGYTTDEDETEIEKIPFFE